MSAPVPHHHGRHMEIARSRMRCSLCGYEAPLPPPGEGPPFHCEAEMVVARDLRCTVCGEETTDTVGLAPHAEPTALAQPPALRQTSVVTPPPEVSELAGKIWAGYEIVSEIGRGGMAIVYKARQPRLDRHVAIKLLLPQGPHDPNLISRFEQEARLIASLRHPNIVTVLEFGEEQRIAYLVMEYVEGETLLARMGRPLPLDQALSIAAQVGRALDYAHEKGVVHRDVKPSNILMARQDWALLSDFGIAKALESPLQLTQAGVAIGTPEYMSPEQCRGLPVDARCDLYSLGVVLYEMLTGRPPFTGDTPLSVMLMHVNEALPLPRSFNPDIPEAVERTVLKATAKNPDWRYQTAREMAAALEALATRAAAPIPPPFPEPAPPEPAPRPPSPRPPAKGPGGRGRFVWVIASLAAALTAAAVLAVVVATNRPPRETPATVAPTARDTGPQPEPRTASKLTPVSIEASSVAPPSQDAAGVAVTYEPDNAVDGDPETTWRTPGNGAAQSLAFDFGGRVEVTRVGLIPGYAKIDPVDGTDRFRQNRIVRKVRWVFEDESSIVQTFEPRPELQFLDVRAFGSRVLIEILETTDHGGRDFTAISEIEVLGFEA